MFGVATPYIVQTHVRLGSFSTWVAVSQPWSSSLFDCGVTCDSALGIGCIEVSAGIKPRSGASCLTQETM